MATKKTETSPGLAAAAEALVRAATEEVENTALSLGRETVDGLKKISSDNVYFKESFDAKINTVNQNIANMTEAITAMKKEVMNLNDSVLLQNKRQTIEWAISNAEVNEFTYYEKDANYGNRKTSTAFIKCVLLSFRRGIGWYIDNRAMAEYQNEQYYHDAKAKNEASEQKFRDTLSSRIHDLTGVKPRVAKSEGKWAIFYS